MKNRCGGMASKQESSYSRRKIQIYKIIVHVLHKLCTTFFQNIRLTAGTTFFQNIRLTAHEFSDSISDAYFMNFMYAIFTAQYRTYCTVCLM